MVLNFDRAVNLSIISSGIVMQNIMVLEPESEYAKESATQMSMLL